MIKHKILQVGCGHMYAWAQNVRTESDCQFVGAVDLFLNRQDFFLGNTVTDVSILPA